MQHPLDFLRELTGHEWDAISPGALKHRKVPDISANVVAVVEHPNESLLGSEIDPVEYYIPYDETLHGPHSLLWEEYLENGAVKYGAKVFPAVKIDLDNLPKISLKRVIYPYIIEGELGLTGEMIISNMDGDSQMAINPTHFSVSAGMEMGDIISGFEIGDFGFTDKISFSISNKILDAEISTTEIEFHPPSPELIVKKEPDSKPITNQYENWKIEYQLGYEFKGTAKIIPPGASPQDQTQKTISPLTIEQAKNLGIEVSMSSILIMVLLAFSPVGA